MNYKIKQYKQKGSFTPFLTVLDMISHLGKDSIASMESNKTERFHIMNDIKKFKEQRKKILNLKVKIKNYLKNVSHS